MSSSSSISRRSGLGFALLSCFCLLLATASAQTTVPVFVGIPGTTGCQGAGSPPPLSGGSYGMGVISFTYNASNAQLTVVVENITPVVSGFYTPAITDVYFNTPVGITGAAMLSQVQGSGTTAPQYTVITVNSAVNCYGTLNLQLDNGPGTNRGILNAAATLYTGTNMVAGPVSFVLQLSGPATGIITSLDFAQTFTLGGAVSVAVAMKLQGGGFDGSESGVQGSEDCPFPSSVQNFPQPCGDPLIAPIVSATSPVIGQNLTLGVTSGLPWAYGYTFLSVGAPPVLTYQTCNIYVDLLTPFNFILIDNYVTDLAGGHQQVLPIPNAPVLYGMVATIQVRLCSPFGPAGPLSPDWVSNGLRLTLGCP